MDTQRSILSRRSALKALGASAGAVAFVPWLSDDGLLAYHALQTTNAAPKLLVLSPAQYATLEALVETIIPADERSPGAKKARVADYVDLLLATAGIKVLLLEAGRMLDWTKEYRTMEWPYQSGRRNRLPPGERAIGVAEYSFMDRPYGDNPAFAKYKKLTSYGGNTFTRNWVVDEKQHPTTGTPYSWVRARVLGGRTNFWGRGALRYGPQERMKTGDV